MLSTIVRLAATAALACSAGVSVAQAVKPPPLPPGSNMVRVDPGLNEDERKRYVRAHHHKMHHGKDYTKDDSVAGKPVVRTGAPAGAGATAPQGGGTTPQAAPANGGGAAGGPGTGPAREQTDRGASSWFHGQTPKKK